MGRGGEVSFWRSRAGLTLDLREGGWGDEVGGEVDGHSKSGSRYARLVDFSATISCTLPMAQ